MPSLYSAHGAAGLRHEGYAIFLYLATVPAYSRSDLRALLPGGAAPVLQRRPYSHHKRPNKQASPAGRSAPPPAGVRHGVRLPWGGPIPVRGVGYPGGSAAFHSPGRGTWRCRGNRCTAGYKAPAGACYRGGRGKGRAPAAPAPGHLQAQPLSAGLS
ncbi:hypothetical protein ACFSKU_15450 [Pontibacter silvestris]|uniref:Uncharacterized protein n=1 Tax=Pontibacter silvestris TaxID=2305183 RepID=A0ABW4X1Y4_9BACT|nr:hypothetical protein [Pontibacter silvestris]MCC9137521.1 hypothetical protein [Pontibacter silvestris]